MITELKGTVKAMFETKVVSDKFSQKEIVITIDEGGKYPQPISVMANNEAIHKLDSISVGDSVTAIVNINGREWTNKQNEVKYFNTLTIFKITKEDF